MGFRQNSLPFELEAGSGQRAEATGAFDIIGEMVATEERREYPEGVRCPHGLFDPNNSGGIALRSRRPRMRWVTDQPQGVGQRQGS